MHSVHELSFDANEYFPAAHLLHELAPAAVPVSVIEPASQAAQDESVDTVEYLPASHAVHAVAPAAEPMSVIEPAAHSEQYDFAVSP